jgi:hypothetical protein
MFALNTKSDPTILGTRKPGEVYSNLEFIRIYTILSVVKQYHFVIEPG